MGVKKIRRYIIDKEGRRRWYSGDTEKEAALELRLLTERLKKESMTDDSVTFREWCNKWLAAYRANDSKPSHKQNLGRLEKYVFPYIGAMAVTSIKPIHIQNIFARTADLSYSTNHKLYITLSQIFNAAIDNDIIIKSPMRGVTKPKGTKGTRRALTEEERAIILKNIDNTSDSMLVMLCLYCGLRPQEAAALTWRDIDIKNRRINVNKALKSDGTTGAPKSQAGIRSVPIPDDLLTYLVANKGTGHVCRNRSGKPLTMTTIRQAWARFRRRAGIDYLPLYTLRHTYCTDLETAGVPINLAKLFMGHESIKVTAGIYTHTQEEAVENALTKINQKSTFGGLIRRN